MLFRSDKIELIKRAIFEKQVIEFDYYYEKGSSRRRIEPYVVIFKWTSWYAFGFCLERQDWRMFKLLRLWNLNVVDERYTPREIPAERRDFETHFTSDIKCKALFAPSERYRLIESYGLDCYTETADGLLFEFGFENRSFLLCWLLGFGDKVKVLEPECVINELRTIAENMFKQYKQT